MNNKRLISLTVCLILATVLGISSLVLADIASETDTKAQQHFEKANELRKVADHDAAIAEYEKAISLSPKSKIAQDAQYWIGHSHFQAGRLDAALSAFQKLLDEYPASAIIPSTKLMIERVQQAKKNKSLFEAVKKGDMEQVKRLIAEGADVNATEGENAWTPLLSAASEGHAEVVKVLLTSGAKVNLADTYGYTALYYAIWNDDEETVKALISGGADVNKRPADENDYYSPLVYAIWQGHAGIVKAVLDAGADINTKDEKGYTPLYWAAFTSKKDVFDLILTKKDWPDTIHLAACKGNLDRVKTLTEGGTDVDAKDEFGCTPLHWAVLADSPAVADYLIAKGADLEARDKRNLTPLMNARTLPVVELLVSKGADIHAKFEGQGRTKLHQACFAGNKDVAEFLIRKGADVNAKLRDGVTPLWLAARGGHTTLVELLIAKGADINVSDNQGRTPLAMARQRKQNEVVDILLKHGAKQTLHAAVASGDIDEVKRLLSQGANINAQNESGQTPLLLALNSNRMDIAEQLVANGANVNAISGQTGKPLLLSVGRWESMEFLISKGADIEAKDGNGLTLLQLTAAYSNQKNYLDIVEFLLEKGADIEARGYGGGTPLHEAVAVGRKEAAELLLAHGAKINVISRYWGTPAHGAMSDNHPDLVRWCISKGIDIPPLHQAAYFGEIDKVRSLLSAGTDVNQKDKAEFTPLHCAVFGRNSEIVQLLLENGADVKARNCAYATPLFLACSCGSLDMVKILVDNGAEIKDCALRKMTWGPKLMDNWSNLHIASFLGHADVVEYLLDNGADIHAKCTRKYEGLTPLHLAAWDGRLDVVKVLIAKGADVNLKSNEGHTALDLAKEMNRSGIVELLLKHGAKE